MSDVEPLDGPVIRHPRPPQRFRHGPAGTPADLAADSGLATLLALVDPGPSASPGNDGEGLDGTPADPGPGVGRAPGRPSGAPHPVIDARDTARSDADQRGAAAALAPKRAPTVPAVATRSAQADALAALRTRCGDAPTHHVALDIGFGPVGGLVGDLVEGTGLAPLAALTSVLLVASAALGSRLVLEDGRGGGGLEAAVVADAGPMHQIAHAVDAALLAQGEQAVWEGMLEAAVVKRQIDVAKRLVGDARELGWTCNVGPRPKSPAPVAEPRTLVFAGLDGLQKHFLTMPHLGGVLLATPGQAPGLGLPIRRGPPSTLIEQLNVARSGAPVPIKGLARQITVATLGEVSPWDLERAGETGVRLAGQILLPRQPRTAPVDPEVVTPLVGLAARLRARSDRPRVAGLSTVARSHLDQNEERAAAMARGADAAVDHVLHLGSPDLACRLARVLHAAKVALGEGREDEIAGDTTMAAILLAETFVEQARAILAPLQAPAEVILARRVLARIAQTPAWQIDGLRRSDLVATHIADGELVGDALDALAAAGLLVEVATGAGKRTRWRLTPEGREACLAYRS